MTRSPRVRAAIDAILARHRVVTRCTELAMLAQAGDVERAARSGPEPDDIGMVDPPTGMEDAAVAMGP